MQWGNWILVLLVWMSVWGNWANAQSSCLPDFLALQTQVPGRVDQTFARDLQTRVNGELIPIAVEFRGEMRSDGQMHSHLQFTLNDDHVSLPFNLYAVLVASHGRVLAWWDFTLGCEQPGVSFFPGRVFTLPTLKNVDGSVETLQVMIWGRL